MSNQNILRTSDHKRIKIRRHIWGVEFSATLCPEKTTPPPPIRVQVERHGLPRRYPIIVKTGKDIQPFFANLWPIAQTGGQTF